VLVLTDINGHTQIPHAIALWIGQRGNDQCHRYAVAVLVHKSPIHPLAQDAFMVDGRRPCHRHTQLGRERLGCSMDLFGQEELAVTQAAHHLFSLVAPHALRPGVKEGDRGIEVNGDYRYFRG
jgi:hypothetical protein